MLVSQILDDRPKLACVCPAVVAQSGGQSPVYLAQARVFSWPQRMETLV